LDPILTGTYGFWVVGVGDCDVEALERDRDQLWAEALARFDAGERWTFLPGESTDA